MLRVLGLSLYDIDAGLNMSLLYRLATFFGIISFLYMHGVVRVGFLFINYSFTVLYLRCPYDFFSTEYHHVYKHNNHDQRKTESSEYRPSIQDSATLGSCEPTNYHDCKGVRSIKTKRYHYATPSP
ncbi:hypothetical protein SODALDRAFT_334997 [Sodiomyces alkalinus F11]|uniref:Uncharacterized protein n=1 Tax=Sodiomyces alkalinus (strain CBS 110278 / VKM F-3762 / F11) TaxID=1314773 RepID=A0A3N2PQP5_SODAK|nr:hypothetical protein SODALDRAFT_334997 [Sodiomyces alkalinus F11]ROT36798.1 hypothetical protein SODALDRAFT_334997 [Sodiomyces alkalinus F11]